jgi:hypothetical protein
VFGLLGVPAALHQDVQHDIVLVGGMPEIVLLAVDLDEHLIQMPDVAWARPAPAQLLGEVLAEAPAPLPDALVRDLDAVLGQNQRDLAQTQAKTVVQPNRFVDDLGRIAKTTVGIRHRAHGRHPAIPDCLRQLDNAVCRA